MLGSCVGLGRQARMSGCSDNLQPHEEDPECRSVRQASTHLDTRTLGPERYPLWRAYNVVEAVSRDLSVGPFLSLDFLRRGCLLHLKDRLLKILSTQRLMQQDSLQGFVHVFLSAPACSAVQLESRARPHSSCNGGHYCCSNDCHNADGDCHLRLSQQAGSLMGIT